MKSTLFLALFAAITALHADVNTEYDCPHPMKPLKFTSNQEVDNFNREVQNYKDCIDRFVSEHKENINKSTKAINAAIADWNRFVNMNNMQKDSAPSPLKEKSKSREDPFHNDQNNMGTSFSF